MKHLALLLASGALAALTVGCTHTMSPLAPVATQVPHPQEAHRPPPPHDLETNSTRHEEMRRHWESVYREERLAATRAARERRRTERAAKISREGSPTPLGAGVVYGSNDPIYTTAHYDPPLTAAVYVTLAGQKFHAAGCRYVSQGQYPTSRGNALAQGYEPCSVCHP